MKTLIKQLPIWYLTIIGLGILAFLLYLAYHDEGYNNWSWMQDAGSWVFLFIAWNVLFWFFVGITYTLKNVLK